MMVGSPEPRCHKFWFLFTIIFHPFHDSAKSCTSHASVYQPLHRYTIAFHRLLFFSTSATRAAKNKMPPKKAAPSEKKTLLGRPSNNLKIGIVGLFLEHFLLSLSLNCLATGLPNVGKSSFFNVLSETGLRFPLNWIPFNLNLQIQISEKPPISRMQQLTPKKPA